MIQQQVEAFRPKGEVIFPKNSACLPAGIPLNNEEHYINESLKSGLIGDYETYLRYFPCGVRSAEFKNKVEEYYISKAEKSSEVADYRLYLKMFPSDGVKTLAFKEWIVKYEEDLYKKIIGMEGRDKEKLLTANKYKLEFPSWKYINKVISIIYPWLRGDLESLMVRVIGGRYTANQTQHDTKASFRVNIYKKLEWEGTRSVRKEDENIGEFWIGKYEITQKLWRAVMGNNPSSFSSCGEECPVENVTWDDVKEFINRINDIGGACQYRLPTESEWEYACRSGGKSENHCGGDEINRLAWHQDNSQKMTHPVGRKLANSLGLHDMSGNVWEWTMGSLIETYTRSVDLDSKSESSIYEQKIFIDRVIRGGGWNVIPTVATSAERYGTTFSSCKSGKISHECEMTHEFPGLVGFRLAGTCHVLAAR